MTNMSACPTTEDMKKELMEWLEKQFLVQAEMQMEEQEQEPHLVSP